MMAKPDTPFPRHWLYYIALKMPAACRRGGAGSEAVRHVVTRWDNPCQNPRCGRCLPKTRRCSRRYSLPAIEELTGDDYSEAQQEAWVQAAGDDVAFGKKLAGQLTLIATIQSSPVGFASLKGADHIDMLYRPSERGGAGRRDLAGRRAGKTGGRARGEDPDRRCQRHRGAIIQEARLFAKQRNTVTLNGEWLANTTMQKTLADSAAPGAPT